MLHYFFLLAPIAFNQLCEINCDVLSDLVQFVQFKNHEKHPWRSVTYITKSNTPPWMFFTRFKL